MINREFIMKSIDDAVWKCGQRLRLNGQVKSALDNFAKSTRNRKTEKGILIGENGKELAHKSGTARSVNWGGLLESVYEHNNYESFHIEHNHPNKYGSTFPTSLSEPDFQRLMDKYPGDDSFMVKSVTAEDSGNRTRMTIVRGDDFDKDGSGEDIDKFMSLVHNWDDMWLELNDEYESTRTRLFQEYWGTGDNRHSLSSSEDFELWDELQLKAKNNALKEVGFDDKIRELQGKFRDLDCNLILEELDE